KLLGTDVELLVQADDRKNSETHRISVSARDGRLVHFTPLMNGEDITSQIRPGDIVQTTVTDSSSFFLIADEGVTSHRALRQAICRQRGRPQPPSPLVWAWAFHASASQRKTQRQRQRVVSKTPENLKRLC